jgi:hypothetical protein
MVLNAGRGVGTSAGDGGRQPRAPHPSRPSTVRAPPPALPLTTRLRPGDARLACLPGFLILSPHQAGARSLYGVLTGHPGVVADHDPYTQVGLRWLGASRPRPHGPGALPALAARRLRNAPG